MRYGPTLKTFESARTVIEYPETPAESPPM
jgi:hypothetical protein